MRRWTLALVALIAAGAALPCCARADILPGQTAPNFTKNQLDAAPPAARSLSDYAGKVVVLFLFGYNCPVCIGDCPNFEQNIWQHYQASHPGQVQVLGVDVWNGTAQGVRDFRDQTGASFPLLLQGAAASGGDLSSLYGPWDNYVVINKQGIVRYHAATLYPHGNRYHVNELRATIDSLVSTTADVGDPAGGAALMLAAGPSPFRSATQLRLVLPVAAAARVEVLDLQGRRLARLHDGALPAGESRFAWDGRDASGRTVAPGIYRARLVVGDDVRERRLVRIP